MARPEADIQPVSSDSRRIEKLKSDRYEVRNPFTIEVETWEDSTVIAEWFEAGVIGFGESEDKAVNGLMQDVDDLYDELRVADPDTLGPLPQRWLTVMNQTLAPVIK